MLRILLRTLSGPALAALVLVGCQDLTVPNENNPSLDQAKLNPTNVEAQSGTAFKYMFSVMQGSDIRNGTTFYPSVAESCMGNEMTVGTTNLGRNQDVCLEPRTPMNNFDQGQWINRTPYQMLYGGIASANDVLDAIQHLNVKIGLPTADRPKGVHTDRNIWWNTFMVGVGHAYLGIMFDQAIIVPPGTIYDGSTDPSRFSPYPEVVAAAESQLRDAIALAEQAPEDTTPDTWVNLNPLPRAEVIRIMHSMLARTLVYSARSPEERAAVDWASVIAEADKGITQDFTQQADNQIRGTISYYQELVQLQTDARPSVRLVGPGDTTGAYQAWLGETLDQRGAIVISTPDTRISNDDLSKNGGRASAGAYIQYNSSQTMGSTLGTYLQSVYRGVRYGVGTGNNHYRTDNIILMRPTEIQLLKAEGLIRLGRAAEAVPIINATRVAHGGLPPVDANGPPQATEAERASCVPRKDDGSCGDLMDALMWESRLENFGVESTIAWANARGWGKMVPGTLIHMPVPGRELQTFKMPYYTFGGPNSPGSSP